jgi:hypothetical protein
VSDCRERVPGRLPRAIPKPTEQDNQLLRSKC